MTGEPFSKIYKADLVNGNIENVIEVFDLNSRTNDGIVCFNANNTIAYFSSSTININDYAAKKERFSSKNYSKQQIFSAVKDAYGNWTDYKALPFCDKEATYLNPTLSPDGKFLFFASNQTGTFGGFDLWKVEIVADNSFGRPQNLGPSVNTVFDENFPFIKSEEGHLFFASQGHEGFCGYDIFEIDLNNNQAKPANIGIPFNTEKDDLAFSYYDDKQIGFLTSNRNGNFDIFKIESPKEEFFELKLTDPNTNSAITNVDVQIFDEKGNFVKTLTSDENGLIKDKVPFSKKYVVKIDNDKFEPMSTSIENSFKGIENQTFSLVKKPELVAINRVDLSIYKTNNLLFEFNKASLSEVSKAQLDRISALMKADEQILLEIVSHTDARGSNAYNLKLSEKRAKVALNYLVSQSVDKNRVAVKPMGESNPLVDCGENCSEDEHAKNRRNEFLIVLPDGQRVLSE
jgi:outer membrane protein OmpA-like peptidoglycan-associated protein